MNQDSLLVETARTEGLLEKLLQDSARLMGVASTVIAVAMVKTVRGHC